MKNLLSIILLITTLAMLSSCEQKEQFTYAEIETEFGIMKVKLYNDTPLHRDNFIKLAKEGFYDGLLFHRIIKGFMAQGGDPDSRDAAPEARLGGGSPGYVIDAEIGHPHFKGALAAARLGGAQNPEKKSSGSQFYVVQGKQLNGAEIDKNGIIKGIQYSPAQRDIYMTEGGAPMLDMDYTVFGKVVEGLDIIDQLSAVPTAPGDRPLKDLTMKIRILD